MSAAALRGLSALLWDAALKHRPLCIGMQAKVYFQSFLSNGSIKSFGDLVVFPSLFLRL